MDRLPPHDRSAERSVLGSCLRNNHVIDDVIGALRAEDFYLDAHQKAFVAIVTLWNKAKPVDLVTLADHLHIEGKLADVGGHAYVAELWDAAPTSANATYYAEIVRDHGLTRGLIHAGTEILRDAYDRVSPAKDMVAEAEKKILAIAEGGIAAETFTIEQCISEAYDRLDARSKTPHAMSGIATGFTDLDELTAGLQNSELVLVAARPSVGKTAFAMNLVLNAVRHEHAVYFVSLEQSRLEIAERLMCCDARVDSHRLRRNTLSADDMEALVKSGGRLKKTKLFIDDTPSQQILRIASTARRLKRKNGIAAVFIDYLQLIDPDDRKAPRQEQVAANSRRLKALARELRIPVVAMAQVNRGSEERVDHRPRLSDLRESGALEQDADVVIMLHRPERYEPGTQEGVTEVIVAKQRNGRTGEVTMMFQKEYMRFENYAAGEAFSQSETRWK